MQEIQITAIADDGTFYPIEKLDAHVRAVYHVAVSIFVFSDNRLLLQRRAMDKYHCGGLWANTCCTHPNWKEEATDCADRRLNEELGFSMPLVSSGNIEYSASVGEHLHEHEYVHLFTGSFKDEPISFTPNPDEVMDTAWKTYDEIVAWVTAEPDTFTPWMKIYLKELKALF